MNSPDHFSIILRETAYILYKNGQKFLQSHDIKSILTALKNHSAMMTVFFDSSDELLRVDHPPRPLGITEYIAWYMQKRSYIREVMSLFYIQNNFQQKTALLSGFQTSNTPPLCHIQTLEKAGLYPSLHSYGLNLLNAMRSIIHRKFSHILSPLIIILTAEETLFIAFFINKKIIYIKQLSLVSNISNNLYNSIYDIVQYLKNNFKNDTITPFFLSESIMNLDMVRENFPNAHIFQGETLASFLDMPKSTESLFDQMVCHQRPQQSYGSKLKKNIIHLGVYVRQNLRQALWIFCLFILANSAHTLYQFFSLRRSCHNISQRIVQSTDLIQKYRRKSASFVPYPDIQTLKKIREKSQKQDTKLWEMIDKITQIIGVKGILNSMVIDKNKLTFYLEHHHTQPENIKKFTLLFQKNYPQSEIKYDTKNNTLIVSVISPFRIKNIE